MFGTGFFPTEKTNIYEIESDGLFLTGTSEVALAGLHAGEILEESELPLRYTAFSTNFRREAGAAGRVSRGMFRVHTAFSTNFRREAGAAGRDTRGMFRVHQFNKVEMFVYTRPEESWDEHERLLAIEEELIQGLGLPYRVVDTAAGDLGASAARKYDIEAWFPSQGRYREITSCSNTTDYQARRLGIRYRGPRGLEPVHTLNGTAVTDRAVLAILENFQQEDGSVAVPSVLERFGAPSRVGAAG
jgi:seryl-tRNA synthetase